MSSRYYRGDKNVTQRRYNPYAPPQKQMYDPDREVEQQLLRQKGRKLRQQRRLKSELQDKKHALGVARLQKSRQQARRKSQQQFFNRILDAQEVRQKRRKSQQTGRRKQQQRRKSQQTEWFRKRQQQAQKALKSHNQAHRRARQISQQMQRQAEWRKRQQQAQKALKLHQQARRKSQAKQYMKNIDQSWKQAGRYPMPQGGLTEEIKRAIREDKAQRRRKSQEYQILLQNIRKKEQQRRRKLQQENPEQMHKKKMEKKYQIKDPHNFYALLGLQGIKTYQKAQNVKEEELKRAYHKVSLKYHPDRVPKNQKDRATRRFTKIVSAYEFLLDKYLRKRYNHDFFITHHLPFENVIDAKQYYSHSYYY